MAKIAGIYANGFGAPVAGVHLVLTARDQFGRDHDDGRRADDRHGRLLQL